PAGEQETERIGEGERCADQPVVLLAPAELLDQGRCEDAEHGAIDIVDRGREKQQRADDPAVVADPGRAAWCSGGIEANHGKTPLAAGPRRRRRWVCSTCRSPPRSVIALSVSHSGKARPPPGSDDPRAVHSTTTLSLEVRKRWLQLPRAGMLRRSVCMSGW